MDPRKISVAILIPAYNGKPFIDECLSSIFLTRYDSIKQFVYIIDNNSSDGTGDYLKSQWPEVRLIRSENNLGFAGGLNLGWKKVIEAFPNIDYIFLLNQDTRVEANFLTPLVHHMEQHPEVGAVQPKILLFPETNKINTLGNIIHYLGFGYSSFNGMHRSLVKLQSCTINYASGAGVLLRAKALHDVGLFDDFMFMYLEDLDLGWKLYARGWLSVLIPESTIYHAYEFSHGMKQYYYFERNRLWILLKNYHIMTLVSILPVLIIMEVGQIIRALYTKRFLVKIKTYFFFLSLKNLIYLYKERRRFQNMRVKKDRDIIKTFSGRIDFQPIHEPLLDYIANPFFNSYFYVLKKIIFW